MEKTQSEMMPVLKYNELIKEHPDCPKSVPFELLSESQAKRNHSQTLQRLAERGGLYPCEMIAVMDGREWVKMLQSDAISQINAKLEAYNLDRESQQITGTAEEILDQFFPIQHIDVAQFEKAMQAYASTQSTTIERLTKALESRDEIFKWLLGHYDFPEPPAEGRPRYYWRSNLQDKLKEAGIDIEGIKSPFQPRETK